VWLLLHTEAHSQLNRSEARGRVMNQARKPADLWSIVLAGGEGERLKPMVQRWLGQHKPKQYCAFIGTRSMLQHTLDRADQISDPGQKVTVIARDHHKHAWPQHASRKAGKVILQPENRDTAAGIFLALSYVRACDPQAMVVIYPSDHFIYPEDPFVEIVQDVVRAARQRKHFLFLLGVSPDRMELEYGWIQPGSNLGRINGHAVRGVQTFLEKPGHHEVEVAMSAGAIWNTMIMAARVETLWAMGWRCFPKMMPLFEIYSKAIGTPEEDSLLETVYSVMPVRNFSSHLLECVPNEIAVIELGGVLWCDWGKPDRIVDTLRRIGKSPSFSLAHATAG
jgi:mannose-1-phosphate guanylyltransferase